MSHKKYNYFFESGVCLSKFPYEKMWDHLGKREKLDLGLRNDFFTFDNIKNLAFSENKIGDLKLKRDRFEI